MKKRTWSVLTAATFLLLSCICTYAQTPSPAAKNDENDLYVHNFNGKPGDWAAVVKNERIYIEFAGNHWNTGRHFLVSEFSALPLSQPGTFKLQREAGTVTLEGVFNNGRGIGTYRFEENPAFKTFLSSQGFSNIDTELMLNICFTDINAGYFDYLKTNGYSPVTAAQLKDLAEQDINRKILEEDFALFAKQGYGKVSLDKIIAWREHGVNAAFVNSFVNAGYKDISVDRALTLRDHGVNMDFIQGFDVKNIPLDKAIDLRDHGVSPEYIKELHDMGWKDISLETATELRDHGVSTSFVKELQAAGYKDLSYEKAKDLIDHGVSSSYIKELNSLGWKDISLETATELRDHGVSASFVKELQAIGYKDISPTNARDLKDHGVNASFINSFKEIGFKDVTLERAQELRDNGLTAAFIKKMQQKGMVNLTLDEYQKLKNAGM
jgi:hypothetical protein